MGVIKTAFLRVIWVLVPTCQEMSRLSSRAQETGLGFPVRMRMHLHFRICVWCERYFRQLGFLKRISPHFTVGYDDISRVTLPQECQDRLKNKLRLEQ